VQNELVNLMGDVPTDVDESHCKSISNFLKIAGPMAVSQFIQEGVSICNMVLLSHYSDDARSAVSIIIPLQNFFLFSLCGPLLPIQFLAGQNYGQYLESQDKTYLRLAGDIYKGGLITGMFCSGVSIGLFFAAEPLLSLLGQDARLTMLAGNYFKSLAWGVPSFFCLITAQKFCDGVNHQHVTAICNFLTCPILLGSGYILVFGKLGCPEFGVAGFGIAYASTLTINLLMLEGYFLCNKSFKNYNLFALRFAGDASTNGQILCKNLAIVRRLGKIGLPIILQIGCELSSVSLMTILMGLIGDESLAAQGMVNQYIFLTLAAVLAIENANTALVSRSYGAKKYHLLNRYKNIALVSSLGVTALPFILSLFIPQYLAAPYININDPQNNEILIIYKSLLPLSLANIFFEDMRFMYISSCRGTVSGMWDTVIPMLASGGCMLTVGTIFEYLIGIYGPMGPDGVALGRGIGLIGASFIMGIRWYYKYWHILNNEMPEMLPACSCHCSITFFKRCTSSLQISRPEVITNLYSAVGNCLTNTCVGQNRFSWFGRQAARENRSLLADDTQNPDPIDRKWCIIL
jgi:MATE family multidrug resistance protein